ncbi:MAG: cation-translocating P-type ATPase [Desulfobacteraceae bacterium]|nr:MAG: cation-translocating P-type ATPase [Desulfobacteraceae bacterium]
MNTSTAIESASPLWSEEPSIRPDRKRIRARIGGLHCSLCTGTIEKALGKRQGVDKVAVSLTHEQALVEYDPAKVHPGDLLQILRDIGYTVSDPRKVRPYEEEERALVREGKRFLTAIAFSLMAIALNAGPSGGWPIVLPAIVFASMATLIYLILRRSYGHRVATGGAAGLCIVTAAMLLLQQQGLLTRATPFIVAGLAVTLVFGVGNHILGMAVQSVRRGILNQHVLLEAGAFAGLGGGLIGLIFHPPGFPTTPFFAVAVMVVTYHIFSEWLSLIVKTRSSQAVKHLLDLQPETAWVMRENKAVELPVEAVAVGDRVRIRPGERVPVDGQVISGHSAVDQALVTGEPMPVEKTKGDTVVGGSINGTGTLLVKVAAVGKESFLQQVIRQVEDARALKPGLLHLVDRILRIYTPTVLSLAILAFAGWLGGSYFFGGQVDLQRAAFAGLSVLVMGYPCALGISAPLSIVRGAGEAATKGILMRTGEAFQGYRLATRIVFDKTGTLTEGRPLVREIEAIGANEEELLAVAGAVEASSEHPLAQAIVNTAFERGIDLPEVDDFKAVPGEGVEARIAGTGVLVGNPAFMEKQGIGLKDLAGRIEELEETGRTVIAVAKENRALGIIALGDRLRPDAVKTVAEMRRAGLKTVLLTGDNERAARRIAREVGIGEVYAGVKPGDKADMIRRLQKSGRVAMIGDGINDAPALMQADIGVAMGSGTDIAIESADIVILGNRLELTLAARKISRYSYRKMLQNIVLAFMFNGIGVPLAATGLIYPVWAMAAMAVSVTTIFFNSLWGKPSLFFDAILSVGQPIQAGSGKRP